jgi:glycerol-3-phosphate cytidylyltransferase-like family protein
LQKVWQKDKLQEKKKVMMQILTRKQRKKQPALKQKHRLKVVVAVDVVETVVVETVALVARVVLADSAVALHKAVVMPVVADLVVEGDN